MVIKAKSWMGRRTKVWDACGVPMLHVKELDTGTKTAIVYETAARLDGKPGCMILSEWMLGATGQRVPITKTVDATGWSYKLGGILMLKL